ncbi:MAG: type II secretion system protein GspM [Pseudomonadota bacterium]
MKRFWQKLSVRIDSRTLRERAMLFMMAAALIIFLVFFFFLNPSYAKQKQLLADMARQQDRIAAVEAEITTTMEAHTLDPDAADRVRIGTINAEAEALKSSLTEMQKAMVPPERMTGLLEQILRGHRGLRLKSLRTLPETEAPAVVAAAPAVAPAPAAPAQLLHKHGVELVVQGSYLDMLSYMKELEGMQGQIFWGNAAMAVEAYPGATLTLTVYTINLDKKWLKL